MICKPPMEERTHLFHLMDGQKLRKAVSDASFEMAKIGKDLETIDKIEEVEEAKCECCGLKEDCTTDYIMEVKNSYFGKWVCGLCSEAVKERLRRAPQGTATEEALRTQRNVCEEFKNTTRLNPKLSLAGTMRKIARRSFEKRIIGNNSSLETKIGRSTSCVPRIDLTPN